MIYINNKINSESIASLIPALCKSIFFGFGISLIFSYSNTSTPLAVLIGCILSFLYLLVFLNVYDYKSDKTFIEKLKEDIHPIISLPLIILILFSILFLEIIVFFIIEHFILSHYLTKTPIILVDLLLASSLFYITTKDYEVLTRVSFILVIFSTIILLINIFGMSLNMDFNNIFPIYNYDNKGIILSSFTFFSFFSSPLFLITFIKKDNIKDKNKTNKIIIRNYIGSIIITILMFFLLLTTLGNNLISIYSYPEYIALKKIKFGFIERIENIGFLAWSIFALIMCSTSSLYLKNSISSLLKVKNKNIISLIIVILVISISNIIFINNISIFEKVFIITPFLLLILIIPVIIVFIIKTFKNIVKKRYN